MKVALGLARIALVIVALFVFSIPSENGVSIPGVGSLSRLLGTLAIAATLLSLHARGKLSVRPPSLFLIVAGVFVMWSFATSLWSIAPTASVSRSLQYVQLLAFAWMIHQLARSERDRHVLMQSFVLGAYAMIGAALASFLGTDRFGYRDVGFPANSFAIVAALTIPMAWGLVLRRPFPRLQIVNFVYPAFALLAIVLAASRGGLVTAIVGLLVIPLTLPNLSNWLRIMLLVVVVSGGVFGAGWLTQVSPELERNLERLGRLEEDLVEGTMTGRTTIWAAGLQVYETSPIVGIGSGAFSRAVQPLIGSARSAHNAFLSVAVTSGAIGLILFTALFLIVLIGVLGRTERRLEYLVLLAALFVSTMPANSENNKYLWYVLAILSAARPLVVSFTPYTVVKQRAQSSRVRPHGHDHELHPTGR